jgi:hypothetical protein
MTSLGLGVVALGVILLRQLRVRALTGGVVLVLVLGVLGLAETGAYLAGQDQFVAFVQGRSHHLVFVVPHPGAVLAAAAGSLVLAAATGALRAPSEKLWLWDGQVWRQGTALTLVLWLVSLGLHLGYDAVVGPGAAFGTATMMLYFAASVAAQRAALGVRARRLRSGAVAEPRCRTA